MKRSELLKLAEFTMLEMRIEISYFSELVKRNCWKVFILERNMARHFVKVGINLSPNQTKINNQLQKKFNINKIEEKCTPYDYLAALRFYMRKIKVIRKTEEERRVLLQKNSVVLHSIVRELERLPKSRKRDKAQQKLKNYIHVINDAISIRYPDNLDIKSTLQELFNTGWMLEKNKFIQLVTLQDGHSKDYITQLDLIPSKIGFLELYKLIVIEGIESIHDSYLLDALSKNIPVQN